MKYSILGIALKGEDFVENISKAEREKQLEEINTELDRIKNSKCICNCFPIDRIEYDSKLSLEQLEIERVEMIKAMDRRNQQ